MVNYSTIKQYINTHIFTIILNGLIKIGKPNLIPKYWNVITKTNSNTIKPNINTYAVALLGSSIIKNEKLVDKLSNKIDNSFQNEVSILIWTQMITAYGNINSLNKMWMIYDKYKSNLIPNIEILSTLISFENRIEFKHKILHEINAHISDWKSPNNFHLKGIYRFAISLNDTSLANKIQSLTSTQHSVNASFHINSSKYSTNNTRNITQTFP